MRPWLVAELGRDLLGPRSGMLEELDHRPDLDYSLGILAPFSTEVAPLRHLEDGEPIGEEVRGDEDSQDADVAFSPGLDPKSKPSTMGLSFTCRTEAPRPSFNVALSWARYLQRDTRFVRQPRAVVLPWATLEPLLAQHGRSRRASIPLAADDPSAQTPTMVQATGDSREATLSLILRPSRDEGVWTVTLTLTSRLEKPDGPYDSDRLSELNLHQPEIRVTLTKGCTVCEPDPSLLALDEEASVDGLLYKGRGQVARGHLCSAVWRAFDPQDIPPDKRATLTATLDNGAQTVSFGNQPPFAWVDREHPALGGSVEAFYPPDVRTEYLPLVNLPAPDMNPAWDSEPDLTAEHLAQAHEAAALEALLRPLCDGYQAWLEQSFDGSEPHHHDLQQAAADARERMQRGLDLLISDQDARLAFNLANEAVRLANHWKNPDRPLRWRKFQMAFALSVLESVTHRGSADRAHLDLLWVATGGGKTEAYLLVTAYLLAYRRLRPDMGSAEPRTSHWQGTTVLTRYTLRLLTIQQFRRALGVMTALEWLRVQRDGQGWLPTGCEREDPWIWGRQPFGIGIWVGGGVTPNRLGKEKRDGAPDRLDAQFHDRHFDVKRLDAVPNLLAGDRLTDPEARVAPEPAQVLQCPACQATLSFPRKNDNTSLAQEALVHWLIETDVVGLDLVEEIQRSVPEAVLDSVKCLQHDGQIHTLSLKMTLGEGIDEQSVEELAVKLDRAARRTGATRFEFCAARPSRPGYFLRTHINNRGHRTAHDFEIRCPNAGCPLNTDVSWSGRLPAGAAHGRRLQREAASADDGHPIEIVDSWRLGGDATISRGVPIPAFTVDDQVYGRLPSVVISTVDKIARMPFEPRVGQLFGNVTDHHEVKGFCRQPGRVNARLAPIPGGLDAPELIIQDELHLIEGPLGSMVGFYETVVEALIREGLPDGIRPKYIASTATIRSATPQVQCLFDRGVHLFPPKGPSWKDRGLLREDDDQRPWSTEEGAGRLYLGLSPIGVSGLGFLRDVYASVLNNGVRLAGDRYWTMVGYYNAIRELAGGRALMEQDVPAALLRLQARDSLATGRTAEVLVELSSRLDSTDLPLLLDQLEKGRRGTAGAVDALLTTSMFGTGVDVNRLNAMLVVGQPKTTAQYIQATGRVGRQNAALIATYLKAARPRDLDHYERFVGYHLQIHRFVEPVTVRPYSFPVLERAGGPLSVAWLRNSREAMTHPWRDENAAQLWATGGRRPPEFDRFLTLIEERNDTQTTERKLNATPPNAMQTCMDHGWARWAEISANAPPDSRPVKWVKYPNPFRHDDETWVVLGDERHVVNPRDHHGAYSPDRPTPQSLRSVDSTVGVKTRDS